MSQAGAQVASDQFSPPNLMNGSKPSKNLSGNRRKGSKPINSRRAFIGAIAVPVLSVMTASSNLKKQPLISLIRSEPSPPRMLHRRQGSIALGDCAISVRPHISKSVVETRFFAASDTVRGLRLLAGEERSNALLLILFDRTPGVLTRLDIGAKYEKHHEFLNAARRFGSLRNLSGQRFWSPGGIADIGGICGWSTLVLLPEIERRCNFGRLTDSGNDSLRRNFDRASKKIRRSRQTNRHRRPCKLVSE